MSLSSTSTPAQVLAEYRDTMGYDVDGGAAGVALAKRFRVACRALMLIPKESIQGVGSKIVTSPEQLRLEIEQVTAWLAGNDTTGGGTVGGGGSGGSVSYGPGGPTVSILSMDGGR